MPRLEIWGRVTQFCKVFITGFCLACWELGSQV
jgi:hypothetical protein